MYNVVFRSDGSATYYGLFYVPRFGKYIGHVDFQMVAAWLDSENVDKFQDLYGQLVFDGKPVTLTVVRKDGTKTIHAAIEEDLPPQVIGIENALDGFADRIDWQPADAIDSYLGIFVDDSRPGILARLYIYPDMNERDDRADGSIGLSSLDRCAPSGVLQREIPISVRTENARYVITEDRPPKNLHATTRAESMSMDIDGHRTTFRRVTWTQARAIWDDFKPKKVDSHRAPADCPSPAPS